MGPRHETPKTVSESPLDLGEHRKPQCPWTCDIKGTAWHRASPLLKVFLPSLGVALYLSCRTTNLDLEELAPWGGKKALESSDRHLCAALAPSNLSRHSLKEEQGRGWHLPVTSSPLSPLVMHTSR